MHLNAILVIEIQNYHKRYQVKHEFFRAFCLPDQSGSSLLCGSLYWVRREFGYKYELCARIAHSAELPIGLQLWPLAPPNEWAHKQMPSCAYSGLQQHFGNQYDFPGKLVSSDRDNFTLFHLETDGRLLLSIVIIVIVIIFIIQAKTLH